MSSNDASLLFKFITRYSMSVVFQSINICGRSIESTYSGSTTVSLRQMNLMYSRLGHWPAAHSGWEEVGSPQNGATGEANRHSSRDNDHTSHFECFHCIKIRYQIWLHAMCMSEKYKQQQHKILKISLLYYSSFLPHNFFHSHSHLPQKKKLFIIN